jgi:hypothetical protein
VFWFLLFAHFLADYPLQTTWMVMNKNRPGVLLLHVTIHFVVGLIFVLLYAPKVWPFLILLSAIHFLIDTGKKYVNQIRPNWVIAPYFIDQLVHLILLILIAILMANYSNVPPFVLEPVWLITLIAYLVVTYVWYISERIIAFHNAAYFNQVVDEEWSRMLARAIFLTISLIAWSGFSNPSVLALGVINFPYRGSNFGIRALFTDLIIAGGGALFVLWIVS